MRIVQVINSLNIGGAEKLVLDLSLQFNKYNQKCDVIILATANSIFEKKLRDNNVKVINLNKTNIYNPFIIFDLIKVLKNNYDIVITHLFPAQYWIGLAKLFLNNSNIKFISIEHSCNNGRRKFNIFQIIDKFIYKQYDKIISISSDVHNSLIEWINPSIKEENKYTIIPNGVDIQRIRNTNNKSVRKEYNISDNVKVVMCIARLEEVKNHQMQIMALANCTDDVHLVLVGDGTLRDNLKSLAIKENVFNRVHFLGIQDDIPKILQMSDLVILTSKWEGLPLSCIEGMSIRPFIGTDVDGIRDLVKGWGVLVEPNNYIQLSKEITDLFSNKEYYNKIKNNCYERANSYDIQNTVRKYLDTFKAL